MDYAIALSNQYNGTVSYVRVKSKAIGYHEAVEAVKKSCKKFNSSTDVVDEIIEYHNSQKENKKIQIERLAIAFITFN